MIWKNCPPRRKYGPCSGRHSRAIRFRLGRMRANRQWLLGLSPLVVRRYWFSATIAAIVTFTSVGFATSNSMAVQPPGLANQLEWALQRGQSEEMLAELSERISKEPDNANLYVLRGSLYFRTGRVQESLADFDVAVEKSPDLLPYLWQRGISQYYAGEYQRGEEQFRVHRTVNPNDVENAFWHFLCVAKLKGIEKASQQVLLAGKDSREPLMQVQLLIQGKADEKELETVTEAGPNSTKFYGYLYLGLYADAKGDASKSIEYLEKCASVDYPGYMFDVARVHLQLLKTKKGSKSDLEKK